MWPDWRGSCRAILVGASTCVRANSIRSSARAKGCQSNVEQHSAAVFTPPRSPKVQSQRMWPGASVPGPTRVCRRYKQLLTVFPCKSQAGPSGANARVNSPSSRPPRDHIGAHSHQSPQGSAVSPCVLPSHIHCLVVGLNSLAVTCSLVIFCPTVSRLLECRFRARQTLRG